MLYFPFIVLHSQSNVDWSLLNYYAFVEVSFFYILNELCTSYFYMILWEESKLDKIPSDFYLNF